MGDVGIKSGVDRAWEWVGKAVSKAEDEFIEHTSPATQAKAPRVLKTITDSVTQPIVFPLRPIAAKLKPLTGPTLDHKLQVAPTRKKAGIFIATDLTLLFSGRSKIHKASTKGVSPTTTGNQITTLVDGPDYKRALLHHIATAQKTIWIEAYEWQSSATGIELGVALIEAKKRNPKLDIKVLYDNRDTLAELRQDTRVFEPHPMPEIMKKLVQAGCEVRHTDYSFLRVNHRKISVFDGVTTFIGGQNIGDSYLLPLSAGWTYHDVTQCLTGPAAHDAGKIFSDSWFRAGGSKLVVAPRPVAQVSVGSAAKVRIISHSGGYDRNIERELINNIDRETKELVLCNGFGMSHAIRSALIAAKKRGVKVTWLWGRASHISALMAQESFPILRKYNVDVRHYPRPLHMKAAYFRSQDTMMQGSSNLDGSSTYLNDEAVVQIQGGGVAQTFYDNVLKPDLAISPLIKGEVEKPASEKERLHARILELYADDDT